MTRKSMKINKYIINAVKMDGSGESVESVEYSTYNDGFQVVKSIQSRYMKNGLVVTSAILEESKKVMLDLNKLYESEEA